jgi:hypothetical protein
MVTNVMTSRLRRLGKVSIDSEVLFSQHAPGAAAERPGQAWRPCSRRTAVLRLRGRPDDHHPSSWRRRPPGNISGSRRMSML